LFIANNSAYGPFVWNNSCVGTNGITFTAGDKMIYVEVRPMRERERGREREREREGERASRCVHMMAPL